MRIPGMYMHFTHTLDKANASASCATVEAKGGQSQENARSVILKVMY